MGGILKFKIIDDYNFIIKVNTSYMGLLDDNLYDNLKKILINLRKRYYYEINGFYEVEIYEVKNFFYLIKFSKKDDDVFNNNIDLKIIKNNKEIDLSFEDYFLLEEYNPIFKKDKYVICSSNIDKKDVIKLCEFYDVELNLQ